MPGPSVATVGSVIKFKAPEVFSGLQRSAAAPSKATAVAAAASQTAQQQLLQLQFQEHAASQHSYSKCSIALCLTFSCTSEHFCNTTPNTHQI
jgi:hypothetical protein